MQSITINNGWSVVSDKKPECLFLIPEEAKSVTLPYDAMIGKERFFSLNGGEKNSYYPTCVSYFYKQLPTITSYKKVYLNIEGLSGVCDVYIGGEFQTTISGYESQYIDISDKYQAGEILALAIATTSDTGKYIGNGIAGGVSLVFSKENFYIEPNGVFVKSNLIDTKAVLDISIEVTNADENEKYANVFVEIYNEKGKRITKRGKRIKLPPYGKTKTYDLKLKLSRAFEWTNFDPYTYSCGASIFKEGDSFDPDSTAKVNFGIARHSLVANQYRLSDKLLKIKGVVCSHDNGVLGMASVPASEYRKLTALCDIGYNAVRYIGCPTQAVLNTLDKLGLVCVVDIFDVMAQGNYSGDGHHSFSENWTYTIADTIKALRNHPCVAFYSVANNAQESYNRNGGHALVQSVIDTIKEYDPYTLLTTNGFEYVPLLSELKTAEIKFNPQSHGDNIAKASLIAGREKDIFAKLTDPYFDMVDVGGYSYLYPRLSYDESKRPLMSLCDATEKAIDLFEEVDKNMGVVGGFSECGADYLGSAELPDREYSSVKPCICTKGDLDFTMRKKAIAYYKEIVLGKKNTSYMVVQDPDAQGIDSSDNFSDTHALWNWPRHVAQQLKVIVYTSGDIVALFVGGKQVGRKLAGKFNNHMAVFKVNYYQGHIEAVSFHKGVECSRCSLHTATQPKAIKLDCQKKSIVKGDMTYIDINILDKEGRLVGFASRDVEVEVSGEGEFVASGNADNKNDRSTYSQTVAVHDGRAVAVVRGTETGKILVKVTGDGLNSNKISIKVK